MLKEQRFAFEMQKNSLPPDVTQSATYRLLSRYARFFNPTTPISYIGATDLLRTIEREDPEFPSFYEVLPDGNDFCVQLKSSATKEWVTVAYLRNIADRAFFPAQRMQTPQTAVPVRAVA